MWPWGHAAVGYLIYSLGSRLLGRRPDGVSVFVLLLGTQLPDLVDKPLSWFLGVFPQGYSVGHSVFVALPVGLVVLAVFRTYTRATIAFVVGYWSHLAGDIGFGLLTSHPLTFHRVMWPVLTLPAYSDNLTGFARIEAYLISFINFFADEGLVAALVLLAVYFGPCVVAFILWILDGTPGLSLLTRTGHRRDGVRREKRE